MHRLTLCLQDDIRDTIFQAVPTGSSGVQIGSQSCHGNGSGGGSTPTAGVTPRCWLLVIAGIPCFPISDAER
ncbi:hypothetical protein GDO81_013637 [Engystomops pustulosus]|uniref:Uncharacterized protein n=1 Tax=Engystomops pustulosus TaxID=76066 RepID=A0AAV7B2Q2_ENGPU|nr:hypothetical protein GDO81_013637 [Engystomops pustulosus]